MSIYTKTGDQGTTSLVGGVRVQKDDLRVDTYGTVDELNAALSLAAKAVQDAAHRRLLDALQYQLFYLGAELATSADTAPRHADQRLVTAEDIQAMEQAIDRAMAAVPAVHSFVLPGTSEAGSRLHMARTIARRAERRLVGLAGQVPVRPLLLQYLNRLSDCLYALARHEDQLAARSQIIDQVVARYLAAASTEQSTTVAATVAAPTAAAGHADETPSAAPDFKTLHRLLQQAMMAASQLQVPVVIAVVDRHGNPILTYRMPGALLASIELAPKKAYTAVALKAPTHQLAAAIQPGAPLFQLEASLGGKIVTFGGGYPLYRAGRIAGGLGISGGTVEQDMQIAEAAMVGLSLGNDQ